MERTHTRAVFDPKKNVFRVSFYDLTREMTEQEFRHFVELFRMCLANKQGETLDFLKITWNEPSKSFNLRYSVDDRKIRLKGIPIAGFARVVEYFELVLSSYDAYRERK